MKNVILIALLVIGMTTSAQEKKAEKMRAKMENMTPEQRDEIHLKKLTKDLNLDAKQQEQLSNLLAEQRSKREAMKEERKLLKEKGTKPTPEERESFRKEMEENKSQTENKMKEILTPEQFSKWQSVKNERKEKLEKKKNKVDRP